jgi:tellurite resistance protein TerC
MEPLVFTDGSYQSLLWIVFSLFVGVALAIDLGIVENIRCRVLYKNKNKNKNSNDNQSQNLSYQERNKKTFEHALRWTIIWISLAGVFSGLIFVSMGYDKSLLFLTGYAIEKSLSVDNMFVFVLIFSSLGIPYIYQHKVLMLGILSAIAFRIVLILAGISLLESFHWTIYIFGGLLVFTSIRMLVEKREKKIEIEKNIAVRILRKFIPIKLNGLTDNRFLHRTPDGLLYATPMLIALVIVEMTDLVFALDSIPAILAITTDSFLVITSNIFAILGLRSLYFLLAGMMDKFYYLKPGLAAILLFIGTKMLISEFYEVTIAASIAVIFGILGTAIVLSFIRIKFSMMKESR